MVNDANALELIDIGEAREVQREPWEMQLGEEMIRFEAFRIWRDLGPTGRRAKTVSLQVGKSVTTVNAWQKAGEWDQRAAAWDRHCDAVARQAELDALQEMKKRHVQISMQLQALGVAELTKLLRKAKQASKKNTLTATDAAKLVEQGMRLERLNMGEAETVTEDKGGLSWTDLVRKAGK